jgi:hypothetical protein
MAWFISKLSESYTHTITFDLEFINAPDSLLFQGASKHRMTAKLRGSGFLFLRSKFSKNSIPIDLSTAKQKEGTTRYFLTPYGYGQQVDNALQNYFTTVEMERDTLFLKFDRIASKTVVVEPRIEFSLAQNYLQEGEIKIEPDSIRITGPKNEIDTIVRVVTEEKKLKALTADFVQSLTLKKSKALKQTSFSTPMVRISGKVAKFSEIILQIPIEVVNVPEDMEIRTFPREIPILCKARLEDLKKITPFDFKLIADYNGVNETQPGKLFIQLVQQPKTVLDAQIMETDVEYILKTKP